MHISRNLKWLDVIILTEPLHELQTQVGKPELRCHTVAHVAGLVVEVALLGDEDGILSLGAVAAGSGIGHSVAETSFTFSGAALSVGRQSIAAFCCRHRSSCRRRQAAGESCASPHAFTFGTKMASAVTTTTTITSTFIAIPPAAIRRRLEMRLGFVVGHGCCRWILVAVRVCKWAGIVFAS